MLRYCRDTATGIWGPWWLVTEKYVKIYILRYKHMRYKPLRLNFNPSGFQTSLNSWSDGALEGCWGVVKTPKRIWGQRWPVTDKYVKINIFRYKHMRYKLLRLNLNPRGSLNSSDSWYDDALEGCRGVVETPQRVRNGRNLKNMSKIIKNMYFFVISICVMRHCG